MESGTSHKIHNNNHCWANMFISFLHVALGYNIDTQTRDKFQISHGNYTMEVFQKDTYIGHRGEDFDYLWDYKAMGEGFNLTFRAPKVQTHVQQKERNAVEIKIDTKNEHMIKT